MHRLKIGAKLDDKYVIEQVIGEGGFGITYKAVNERINLKVAIKELFCKEYMQRDIRVSNDVRLQDESRCNEAEEIKSRFFKEARILSDFADIQNVVKVIDAFEENNTVYMVMEYLEGESLRDHVSKNGKMKYQDAVKKLYPILSSLSIIHKGGVLHRDIKPDNIMVKKDGSWTLIDFGAARTYSSEISKYSKVVSLGYSGLEQYSGKNVGCYTDVFALCGTLYYCITGKDPEEATYRTIDDTLQPPSKMGAKINAAVEKIILKGLSINYKDRYQTVDELESALKKVVQIETPGRKSKKGIIIASMITALIAIALGVGYWYYITHEEQIKFRGKDTRKLVLSAGSDMTAEDYSNAKKILEKRLQILFGDDYYIREEDNNLFITTLDEYPSNIDFAVLCKSFISRPCKIYMFNNDYINWSGTFTEEERAHIYIDRDGIKNIEQKKGKLEIPQDKLDTLNRQMDRKENEPDFIKEGKEYKYLSVEFTDEMINKIKDYKYIKPGVIYLEQDIEDKTLSEYYFNLAVLEDDFTTLNILMPYDQENFIELYSENLTMDNKAEQPLSLLNYEMNTVFESDSVIAGDNQVDEDEIIYPAYIFYYKISDYTDDTRGTWFSNLADFKVRLDSLNVPYSFGVDEQKDKNIVVKMSKNDTNLYIMTHLLTAGEYDVQVVSDKLSFDFGGSDTESMEIVGGEQLKCYFNDYHKEYMEKSLKNIIDCGDDTLYLTLGDYRIMSVDVMKVKEDLDKGYIMFDTNLIEDDKNKENYLNLVKSLWKDTTMMSAYDFERISEIDEKGLVANYVGDDEMQEIEVIGQSFEKDKEKIEAYDDNIVVKRNTYEKLSIDIYNMPVEYTEQGVLSSLSLMQKIYEECNLDIYERVTFYWEGEKDTVYNNFFWIKKDMSKGKLSFHACLWGDFYPYRDAIYNALKSNKFFTDNILKKDEIEITSSNQKKK